MEYEALRKFRDLIIDKSELFQLIGGDPIYLKINDPLPINADNVIKMLRFYQTGTISPERMQEWCDVIRFSDLFEYPEEDNEQEAIASVIDDIQDSKMFHNPLSTEKIARWLRKLQSKFLNNIEIIINDDIFEAFESICTTFYIKHQDQCFPNERWSDLTSSVLGMWSTNILQYIVSNYNKFNLYFMDGPYRMEVTKTDDKHLSIECICTRIGRQIELTFQCDYIEFLSELYKAYKKLNFILYERGLDKGRFKATFDQTITTMKEIQKAIDMCKQ